MTIDPDTNIDTLGNDIQNELFYVCKEAVSNALKHSNGSEVDLIVGLESSTGEIHLTVQDNGDGMDDVTLRSSGTQNMEKRMKRIGGTFSLVNADGGGLRARASVSDPDQE